ncbi:hypothetical protein [Streptomyces sp. NBC_00878]|uniref:hypothetical protein n=1 Tax=Streptomyces sp. NBC_00878 TaxID=2975854 RepID=UPI0022567914|nr:hypothetical protein [Streptomyces sp. NBC_00878]MCX4905245.1 hypothetical protein [Streptomyces sp. NBC_00878]
MDACRGARIGSGIRSTKLTIFAQGHQFPMCRWAEFHPLSRLWSLRWAETCLGLLPAGAPTGLCGWWIRRRPV